LENSWQYVIHNIDYKLVFDITLNVLMDMPASAIVDRQLRSLANLAYTEAKPRLGV